MTTKATQPVVQTGNYRYKVTVRDVNAPLGTDYTPEVMVDGNWKPIAPACYNVEDALQALRNAKVVNEVKVSYVYPKL